MSRRARALADGEVVYREGEAAADVYVVGAGRIDLVKAGPLGQIRLASLRKGEMFGEVDALTGKSRGHSALAVGEAEIEEIDGEIFLDRLGGDPAFAAGVARQLALRLRDSDALVAARGGIAVPGLPSVHAAEPLEPRLGGERRPGIVERLLASLKLGPRTTGAPVALAPLQVLVCRMVPQGPSAPRPGEEVDPLQARVGDALRGLEGVDVGLLDRPLPIDPQQRQRRALRLAQVTARRWLAEARGDVLIWGQVDPGTQRLSVRVATAVDDERATAPSPFIRLALPSSFGDDWAARLRLVTLAACDPRSELGSRAQARALEQVVGRDHAREVEADPSLGGTERGHWRLALAQAMSAIAQSRGDQDLARTVLAELTSIEQRLDRDEDPVWALLRRLRAQLHFGLAEGREEQEHLRGAIADWRAALQAMNAGDDGLDWAACNNRLGVALCRLDLLIGDEALLREALGCFQAALTLFGRPTHPHRWAEVMNNLGQALQLYGDQAGSQEILERAVAACRSALEMRDPVTQPIQWSTTRNNLGSALFLLARLTSDITAAEEAVDCLREAQRQVSEGGGRDGSRARDVALRNLAKAEALVRELERKGARRPSHWTDAPESLPAGERERTEHRIAEEG